MVAGLSALVAVASIAREAVVAATLGNSVELEASLVCLLFPMLVANAFANTYSGAIVPLLSRARLGAANAMGEHGVVNTSIRRLMSWYIVSAAVGWLIWTTLSPHLFPPRVLHWFPWQSGVIALLAFGGVFLAAGRALAALLVFQERYLASAVVQSIPPVTVVFACIGSIQLGFLNSLLLGSLIGWFIQFVIAATLVVAFYRMIDPVRLEGTRPLVDGSQYGQQFWALFVGVALLLTLDWVETGFAAALGPGALVPVTLASRLCALISGFSAAGITAALVSRKIAEGLAKPGYSRRAMARVEKMILIGSIAVATLVAWFSNDIATAIFAYGKITAQDSSVVGRLLKIYACAIPLVCLGVFYGRLLSMAGHSAELTSGAAATVATVVLTNWLLQAPLGISGIPVAYGVGFLVSAIWLRLRLKHYNDNAVGT